MRKEAAKWYILLCQKKNEEEVVKTIKNFFNSNEEIKDAFYDIKVIYRKIKSKTSDDYTLQNFHSGYIYIKLKLDETIIYEVQNIPGIYGFLGMKGTNIGWPVPLTKIEVKNMLRDEKKLLQKKAVFNILFKEQELVVIKKHDIFQNQTGKIIKIDSLTGDVTVEVDFLNKKYIIICNYTILQRK